MKKNGIYPSLIFKPGAIAHKGVLTGSLMGLRQFYDVVFFIIATQFLISDPPKAATDSTQNLSAARRGERKDLRQL